MDIEWVRDIRDQCKAANVQFFFKQWGGVNKKAAGRLLDGRTWDQMPGREELPTQANAASDIARDRPITAKKSRTKIRSQLAR
jgi:hypothetical protein